MLVTAFKPQPISEFKTAQGALASWSRNHMLWPNSRPSESEFLA